MSLRHWMIHLTGWATSAPTWSGGIIPAARAPCSPDWASGWRDEHPVHPQALLESVAADVPLARALEDFLTANKLALPPDRDERRAAARRQSRIDAVPEPLQPAVAGFAEHLVAGRDRARRTGTHPRGHATLEARLTAVRDFARFLTARRGKTDWATVDVGDVEAFLHAHPGRRASYLTGLRQFCRHAVRRRLMLIDPTAAVKAPQTMAFRGPTLPADRQRELFRRWSTDPDVHPHEAFVGLAALLHGATTQELQHLTDADIDHQSRRIRLGRRPQPTPAGPVDLDRAATLYRPPQHIGQQQLPRPDHHADQSHPRPSVRQLHQEHPACGRHPTPHPALHPTGRPRRHRRRRNSSPPPTACATRPSSPTSPTTSTPPACRTRDSSGAASHRFARTCALSPSTGCGCSPRSRTGAPPTCASWCATASKGCPRRSRRCGRRRSPKRALFTCCATAFATPRRGTGPPIAKDLKPVYTAASESAALDAFIAFSETWGERYPAIIKLWENAWAEFVPFLAFDKEIRSVICTTNSIESLNSRIRRAVNARGHFPTEQAALKCVYLAIMSLDPTGKGRQRWINRWKAPLNAFEITFPDD